MSEQDQDPKADAPDKASGQEEGASAAKAGGEAGSGKEAQPSSPAEGGAAPAEKAAAPSSAPAPAAEASGDEADTPDPEEEARKKAEAAAKAKEAAEKKRKAEEARKAAELLKPIWERDPATPEWSEADGEELVVALRASFPDTILSARSFAGDLTLVATREGLLELARSLKDEHGYRYMVDVAGVDYPSRDERFEVVYHVYNHDNERRLRLKVSTDETTPVPSLTSVWKGTNWPEREAYDMYGILFEGHPDPTRILLWEGFNGFPLRKEFPVEGIDTGSAIYPEYYDQAQGPISGDGTGWKVPQPPEPAAEEEAEAESSEGES
jgi:NADH-quinone oxidoreductase subunit C